MSKMNPEVKARWVAALRSGEYRQATEQLKDARGRSYCCLGVLCDLFAKEAGLPKWGKSTLSDAAEGQISECYGGDAQLPGARVGIWSGVDPEARVTINGLHRPLYVHNDEGVSFAHIADAIEEQL